MFLQFAPSLLQYVQSCATRPLPMSKLPVHRKNSKRDPLEYKPTGLIRDNYATQLRRGGVNYFARLIILEISICPVASEPMKPPSTGKTTPVMIAARALPMSTTPPACSAAVE